MYQRMEGDSMNMLKVAVSLLDLLRKVKMMAVCFD